MRSQAQTTRMGDSMTVTKQHVGGMTQLAVGGQERWNFPEGKKTRDVRKGNVANHMAALHKLETRPQERHHDGDQPTDRRHIPDVRRSQQAKIRGERPETNLGGEVFLQALGFLGGQVPGRFVVHCAHPAVPRRMIPCFHSAPSGCSVKIPPPRPPEGSPAR